MKVDNDYQELIDELKEEIRFGLLENNKVIQVLREEETGDQGEFPIIDWYYNKETMDIELSEDSTDTKEDIEEKKMIREQYLQDKPLLVEMTVEACLAELYSVTNKPTNKTMSKSKPLGESKYWKKK